MLQTHIFKIIWSQTKHAPDTAPTTTQQSKPRAANPRVLQRTERLLEEGPAAVGVALKIVKLFETYIDEIQQRLALKARNNLQADKSTFATWTEKVGATMSIMLNATS